MSTVNQGPPPSITTPGLSNSTMHIPVLPGVSLHLILPIEVIGKIFQFLPSFDIHRVRQVDKQCKDIVDERQSVFKPVEMDVMDKLKRFIELEVDPYPEGTDMMKVALEGLQRYLPRHPEHLHQVADTFAFLHKHRCPGNTDHYVLSANSNAVKGTEHVFNLFLLIDLKYHPRPGNPQPTINYEEQANGDEAKAEYYHHYETSTMFANYVQALSKLDPGVERSFGAHTSDEWEQLYSKLQSTPGGLFSGINCLVGEGFHDGPKSRFPLTIHVVNKDTLKAQRRMMRAFGLNLDSKEQRMKAGMHDMLDVESRLRPVALYNGMMCSMEEVVSTLDVPELPTLMANGALGYVMRSKLALDLLGQVIDGIMPMTPLLKHFLLSELYIH